MILLPSERKLAIKAAEAEFGEIGSLQINEPCNCNGQISHNNGGNYHEEITIKRDEDEVFVKFDSSSEFFTAEWEVCKDWKKVIEDHSDWLVRPN